MLWTVEFKQTQLHKTVYEQECSAKVNEVEWIPTDN